MDADRDKYAKFYVNQILNMEEEGIRDAYRKVTQHLERTKYHTIELGRDKHMYAYSLTHSHMVRPSVIQHGVQRGLSDAVL